MLCAGNVNRLCPVKPTPPSSIMQAIASTRAIRSAFLGSNVQTCRRSLVGPSLAPCRPAHQTSTLIVAAYGDLPRVRMSRPHSLDREGFIVFLHASLYKLLNPAWSRRIPKTLSRTAVAHGSPLFFVLSINGVASCSESLRCHPDVSGSTVSLPRTASPSASRSM